MKMEKLLQIGIHEFLREPEGESSHELQTPGTVLRSKAFFFVYIRHRYFQHIKIILNLNPYIAIEIQMY